MNDNTIKVNGKVAGVINGDTLKIVKTSEAHYVKRHSGYGVAPETLQQAEARGAKYLHLITHDGEEFRLTIREFIAAAVPDDLGYGRQLFMACKWLRYYTRRTPAHKNEPQPAQLGLFQFQGKTR